jgi:hypothetical protein
MSPKKRKRKERLLALLELQGATAEVLPKEEVHALQKEWRRVFAPKVKKLTGENVYLGFDWHAFSYSPVHSVEGDDARQAYQQESCTDFYVLPHMDECRGYKCQSNLLPQISRKNIDAYICPLDFKWTMVYTHEDDWCGPYFTRAEWANRETEPKRK